MELKTQRKGLEVNKNPAEKKSPVKSEATIEITKLILLVIEEFHEHRRRVRKNFTQNFLARFKSEKASFSLSEILKTLDFLITGKKKP